MAHSRHLKSTVTIETVGQVDISTIDLNQHGVTFLRGYETCLFWGRESEVVESYNTWAEAQAGHSKWELPETLARALHVLYRDRVNH